MLHNVWLYRIVRWTMAVVFLYAGAVKNLHLDAFAETIADFELLHPGTLILIALCIAVLELLTGIGLLLDVRGALALAVGLLVFFVGVLAYGLALGLDVDCGCFGPEGLALSGSELAAALYRDLAMLVLCGYLYLSRHVRSAEPLTLMETIRCRRRSD